MENIDKLSEVIIEINKIATPKCGYFVFWTNEKERLNLPVEPFILKEADNIYPDKHHIEGKDIMHFHKFSPNILTYDKRFKVQAWEDAMKWEIYNLIVNGALNRKAKNHDEDVFVRFVWTGKKVMKSDIEYT